MILCDTDVIIEHFKGNLKTSGILHEIGSESILISAITEMELLFGSKNKRESNQIKKALSDLNLFHLNKNISVISIDLIMSYSKSHGLRIPDAIIAATALSLDIKLFTYNLKDFQFIEGVKLLKI
jgi:predicted nucleic acid-binding protein